jgi:hypothetical protein
MKATGHGDESRKLHKEGCPHRILVEPGRHVGALDRGKMAENNAANTYGRTVSLGFITMTGHYLNVRVN